MKPVHWQVLDSVEAQQIDAASKEILETTGLQVNLKKARDLFRQAGAFVDETSHVVNIPETLVRHALESTPRQFTVYGNDPAFQIHLGIGQTYFAGLGTPTKYLDTDTGQLRPALLEDLRRHLILVDESQNICQTMMDIWPSDIPMTTIHAEAILAWAHHCRKSFGIGAHGVMPSTDMVEMLAIAVGGKELLRQRPRMIGIVNTVTPLKTAQLQLEGLWVFVEQGQPVAISPEARAGATAPVTLAGLVALQNAEILGHITLAQLIRPGTPVLYGTASTAADMATGNVALGAIEMGLITAAATQMAHHYNLPCRGVGLTTDSKMLDVQCALERAATLLPAVLAGTDFITCAGTLESTTTESDLLLVLDDEFCGLALRLARGIEVNETTLAMDAIREVNWAGNYVTHPHTAQNYRRELFFPKLLSRSIREKWEKGGSKTTLDLARERVKEIMAHHEPRETDPIIGKGLREYADKVARRSVDEFYAGEWEA
jgi:trimethylamine:corrinoid methyltransferase-like protein